MASANLSVFVVDSVRSARSDSRSSRRAVISSTFTKSVYSVREQRLSDARDLSSSRCDVVDDDGDGLGLLAMAVARIVFVEERHLPGDGRAPIFSVVAGADEPLEAELVEIGGE